MAPTNSQLIPSNGPLMGSTRKVLLLAELLAFIYVAWQSSLNPLFTGIAAAISLADFCFFFLSYQLGKNYFTQFLPLAFLAVLWANQNSPLEVSYAGYVVPLVFFSIFFVAFKWLQITYALSFILGICISEVSKGTQLEIVAMVLIPGIGFTGLFLTAIKHLQHVQSTLLDKNLELQRANISLQTLLENTHTAIWCIDNQYRFIVGNSNFDKICQKVHGCHLQQGQPFLFGNIHHADKEFWETLALKGLAGEAQSLEKTYVKDHKTHVIEINVYPMRDALGMVTGVTFVSKNVTRKKAFELERKQQQELLNRVINNMPMGFQLFNNEGNLMMVNDRFRQYLNLPEDDSKLSEFNILEDKFMQKTGLSEKYLEAVSGPGFLEFDMEIDFTLPEFDFDAEEDHAWFEFTFFKIRDEAGKPTGMVLLSNDITIRKRHEKILLEQNKRFEEYSFTLSHIIRRPVANIISLTSLINEFECLPEEDKITIRHLHDSSKQLDDIIKNLNLNLNSTNHYIL